MYITHLSLTNFRNYGRLELDFPVGATLLHGHNAQGKTNLLEAIYYLATTRSPHADQDQQLINWEAIQQDEPIVVSRLTAHVVTKQGTHQVEIRLIKEHGRRHGQSSFRREALINRRKVRLMDILGHVRVVLFLPEDVQLLTGTPAQRRRYLNVTLCQIDPIYCRTLSRYNKILEQRNALLRQLAEQANSNSQDILPVFTEKLVNLGSHIFMKRATFLEEIAREAQRIYYEDLTIGGETIRLSYLPRLQLKNQGGNISELDALGKWLQENRTDETAIVTYFTEALASCEQADIARGSTNIGPHRDDWCFWLNGRNLGSYGSRGQQRSTILALKMGEINWMANHTSDTPILLMDEVVAELDEQRRALLLHTIQKTSQAVLTATDLNMFTTDFIRNATTMTVTEGRIQLNE